MSEAEKQNISEELLNIEANCKALSERCYRLRKQLGGDAKPSGSRKGKQLTPKEETDLMANRMKKLIKNKPAKA